MAEAEKASLKEIEKTSKPEAAKPEEKSEVEETKPEKTEVSETSDKPPVETTKKKWFRLPFFGKKSKPEENQSPAVEEEPTKVTQPLSPEDLVNNLDKDIKVLTQTKIDELTQELDKQIEVISQPEVSVSLTKKTLLVSMGLVLGILWAILLGQFVIQNNLVDKVKARFSNSEPTVFEASQSAELNTDEEVEASASASAKTVRIKDKSNKSEAVRELATLLENNGYEYVEIVEDATITETKVTVLTKKDTDDQVPIISDILKDLYLIDQGVSELSEDSDFGVVILFPESPEEVR